MYYALVQSALSYSIVVWGQATESHRDFVLQKRVIRMMFDIPLCQTCRGAFRNKNILTVTAVYILKILTIIHTNRSKFTIRSDIHSYNTRNEKSIHLGKILHLNYKKTPYYAGSFIYNKLPLEWRELPNVMFKSRIKKLLKSGVFYTLDEFYQHIRYIR